MKLILASGSPYRKALLERLQLPFECRAPNVDEIPLPGEAAADLSQRLASLKARAVAATCPDALVIGSDQVACLDGETLGKPGDHRSAFEQLRKSSGRCVEFHTGLCIIAPDGRNRCTNVPFRVYFRELEDTEIEAYLTLEQPYDCAGSFKWEGLGISLFARLEGDDPTSLEGLPLIALCGMLRELGSDPLS